MKILPQHKKRLEILKKIILEYQETETEELLHQILRRIDNLIISTVLKEKGYRKCLHGISYNDLYQYAIIGAISGIKSIPKNEEIRYIPARVVAYIKAQFRKTYRYNLYEFTNVGSETCKVIYNHRDSHYEMQIKVQASDVMDKLHELHDQGKLTDNDLLIIQKRFFEEKKFKDIAKALGIQLPAAWHRYTTLMKKIRTLLGEPECEC